MRREDEQNAIAGLDAVRDVVHDVLAQLEVPLVDAESQSPLVLQDWQQLRLDPLQVFSGVGHEYVVLVSSSSVAQRLSSVASLPSPSTGLVQPQAHAPAEAEEDDEGQEEGEDKARQGDGKLSRIRTQQTGLGRPQAVDTGVSLFLVFFIAEIFR